MSAELRPMRDDELAVWLPLMARRRGLDRVGLWVGGRNAVACGPYRSLGYDENGVAMSKNL